MGDEIKSKHNLSKGLIMGLSLIIASSIGSATFYNVKQFDNTLSVTGSAKQQVTSDRAKWVASFTRTVGLDALKTGYSQMKQDQQVIDKYLKSQGIAEGDIVFSTVWVDTPGKYNQQAAQVYDLRQTVEVQSTDVSKVTSLAKNLEPVINQGIIFSTQSLEYYYTKLPELRVNMLSEAVKDAQARAAKIAESTGRGVGTIRSASMGVVQVLPKNSVEISDYGAYDTSSVEKEVMVTVRTEFSLR